MRRFLTSRILLLASAAALCQLTTAGCDPKRVDVEEREKADVRSNRGAAPSTGVKQNPGSPISDRPTPAPGPGE